MRAIAPRQGTRDWTAKLPSEAEVTALYIVDEFAVHDDTVQFRAGLDLLLQGLRLQAGG